MALGKVNIAGGGKYSTLTFSNLTDSSGTVYLPITIGSKYDFGSGEQTASTTEIAVTSPATGYIKMLSGSVS